MQFEYWFTCWAPAVYIKDTHCRCRNEKALWIYREGQMWPLMTSEFPVKTMFGIGQQTTSFRGIRQIHPNSFLLIPAHFWVWTMPLNGQYCYLNSSKIPQIFPRVKYRQGPRISEHLCSSSLLSKHAGFSQGQDMLSEQHLSPGNGNSEKLQWHQEILFQVRIL